MAPGIGVPFRDHSKVKGGVQLVNIGPPAQGVAPVITNLPNQTAVKVAAVPSTAVWFGRLVITGATPCAGGPIFTSCTPAIPQPLPPAMRVTITPIFPRP